LRDENLIDFFSAVNVIFEFLQLFRRLPNLNLCGSPSRLWRGGETSNPRRSDKIFLQNLRRFLVCLGK